MDPREELELLRKKKRLMELEARAAATAAPTAPDAADKAAQGGNPQAQAISTSEESPLKRYLGKAKSLAEGAGQGLTFGNVGNIGGIVQEVAGKLGTPGQTDRALEAQGFKINQPSGFDIGKAATKDELEASYQENPLTYGLGYLGGSMPLAGSSRMISEMAGGGLKGTTALGGLTGAMSDVDFKNPEKQLYKAGVGSALGLLGGALTAGADKASDVLMKMATGIRRAPEGVGNRLMDQGLWGTKNMMLEQAEQKFPAAEQKVSSLVNELPGEVSPSEFEQAISKVGERFVSPSGHTLEGVAPDLSKVTKAASQFTPGGENAIEHLSWPDVLSLKRQGDWAGFTASGNPATSTEANIARAIGDKARGLLSEASGGETAEALANEQALILAKRALEKDPSTPSNVLSHILFKDVPGIVGSSAARAARYGAGGAGKALSSPAITGATARGLFSE